MPIKVIPPRERIIERHLNENAREVVADVKAVQDYNLMMGNLEDPNEEVIDDE